MKKKVRITKKRILKSYNMVYNERKAMLLVGEYHGKNNRI